MKKTVILFQGDSITDGGRLKDPNKAWDLNHQMGHCYAYNIASYLGAHYPERYLEFINRGISGNRVSDLYGRWKEDALKFSPDVLSVLIGVNDCGSTIHYGTGSEPERFEKIYQLLLDEMKEVNPEVKIVLMEPFILPVGECKEKFDLWNKTVQPLQEKVRFLAERNGAIYVPLQEKFTELCKVREAEYWVWDGIHPTVAGHQIIAEQWLEHIKELLA